MLNKKNLKCFIEDLELGGQITSGDPYLTTIVPPRKNHLLQSTAIRVSYQYLNQNRQRRVEVTLPTATILSWFHLVIFPTVLDALNSIL